MEKLKDKIEKYINKTGVIKTPAYFIKDILIDIIDKIYKTINKVEGDIKKSIEDMDATTVPYIQNIIDFNTNELNIDTKNGYYYTENFLENLKITKVDNTICPKVEFYGYYVNLQLPKNMPLWNKSINFDGFAKYVIHFDNNNCKIDQYTWDLDLSEYLIAIYSEGTTKLTYTNSLVFDSLNGDKLQITTGPVYKNEPLITKIGTRIDSYAFKDCKVISVIIPNSVTSIGNDAFSGCSSLTSITIPESVTSIGQYAFSSCTGLTRIEIPNSLTSIESYTFAHCSSLPSIIIPNSITSIGSYAFYYCKSLTFITIEATTPPTLKYNSFDFTNNNFIIYVPSESVDAYKKATTWKNYANRIKPMSDYQAN